MTQQKNYTWNAKDYAQNSKNQFQWAKDLIPKLKLGGNEHLLDIGCVDGKITAELAKYLPNGNVVGIDSSPQRISLAKTQFPPEKFPHLTFRLMDAQNIPFQEEFELAFSNAALHWILDQAAVLRDIQRSLKTQGRLMLQMAGRGNAKEILDVFDDLFVIPEWKGYFDGFAFPYTFLGIEEYRALLLDAGLEALRVELFSKVMKFSGADELAGWLRTTWLPFTERIPVELRNVFVAEIVNRYLEAHPKDGAGVVRLGMMRLEVETKKM